MSDCCESQDEICSSVRSRESFGVENFLALMMERQFPHTLPLDAGTSRYQLRLSLTWESKEKSNVTKNERSLDRLDQHRETGMKDSAGHLF